MKVIPVIVIILVFSIVLLYVSLSIANVQGRFLFIIIVPPQYAYIRVRGGKKYDELYEGYHLFIPGIDIIYKKVSLKSNDLDFKPSDDSKEKNDPQEFMFKDRIQALLKWTIRFKVKKPMLYAKAHNNPIKALENECSKIARESLAELTSEDITNALNVINARFKKSLDEINNQMQEIGIQVEKVYAIKVDFSQEHEKFLEENNELLMKTKVLYEAAEMKYKAGVKDSEILIEYIRRLKDLGIEEDKMKNYLEAFTTDKAIKAGGIKTLIMPCGDASAIGSLVEQVKAITQETENE